jgi:hypothetical protein
VTLDEREAGRQRRDAPLIEILPMHHAPAREKELVN